VLVALVALALSGTPSRSWPWRSGRRSSSRCGC